MVTKQRVRMRLETRKLSVFECSWVYRIPSLNIELTGSLSTFTYGDGWTVTTRDDRFAPVLTEFLGEVDEEMLSLIEATDVLASALVDYIAHLKQLDQEVDEFIAMRNEEKS